MEKSELISLIEALLFASGKPVSVDTLCELTGEEKHSIYEAVEALKQELLTGGHGIQLIEINDSYQLATLEKYYDVITKMLDSTTYLLRGRRWYWTY